VTLLRSYSPIDMDYVQRNCVRCNGAKLIFGMDGCTSIGPRVRSKAFILARPRASSLATSPGTSPYVFTTEAGTLVTPGFRGWSDLD
jgi:hypothetical protein